MFVGLECSSSVRPYFPPQSVVPGEFEGALVERSLARVHGVSHRGTLNNFNSNSADS